MYFPDHQLGEHENKFIFSNAKSALVRSWLGKRCLPDPIFSDSIISSIYYDTRNMELLSEKLASDFLKMKVRLRWYHNFLDGSLFPDAYVEVKNKIGSARVKKRFRKQLDSQFLLNSSLEDPEFIRLVDEIPRENTSVPFRLFPILQINYRRSRYIDMQSGARLSFDSDIHVSRINKQFVKGAVLSVLPEAVFECKGKMERLPEWLHQINAFGGKRYAFSKYSECLQHILNRTH